MTYSSHAVALYADALRLADSFQTHPIRETQGGEYMSTPTPTSFPTSQSRVVETPVSLTVRPSKRNPDTIVVGVEAGGERKRAVLVRVTDDGTVRIRTLDGNPREASSKSNTQTVLELSLADLTEDTA